MELAALSACIILASLAIFQVALIAGAPLGAFAWGGTHKVLPPKLRVSSAISILIYLFIALIILSKAGIMPTAGSASGVGMWVVAGYFWLGVMLNAISRSKPERNLMTPVALALAVLASIIAIS